MRVGSVFRMLGLLQRYHALPILELTMLFYSLDIILPIGLLRILGELDGEIKGSDILVKLMIVA